MMTTWTKYSVKKFVYKKSYCTILDIFGGCIDIDE